MRPMQRRSRMRPSDRYLFLFFFSHDADVVMAPHASPPPPHVTAAPLALSQRHSVHHPHQHASPPPTQHDAALDSIVARSPPEADTRRREPGAQSLADRATVSPTVITVSVAAAAPAKDGSASSVSAAAEKSRCVSQRKSCTAVCIANVSLLGPVASRLTPCLFLLPLCVSTPLLCQAGSCERVTFSLAMRPCAAAVHSLAGHGVRVLRSRACPFQCARARPRAEKS